MRRFEETREAFWMGAFKTSLVMGLWLWGCWTTFFAILGPEASPETVEVEAFLGLLVSLGLLPYVVPAIIRGAVARWRSRLPITLGDGWLELPGTGRIEHRDVARVLLTTGLLHPRIDIELHGPDGRRRKKICVRPHEYQDGSELRAALMALPTLDRRAAGVGVEASPAGGGEAIASQ